jgi:hypothetical protein
MSTARRSNAIRGAAIALAAVLSMSLVACETATPYQPIATANAVSGGFTDQQLDDTHFRVTFRGNAMTSREQVETYLLYRAAELAVDRGYDWFEMVDRQTHNNGSTYVSSWSPYWRFHGGWGWSGWDPFWGDPFWDSTYVDRIDRYEAIAEVAVGRGPKPAADTHAVAARQVMANLAPKIVRPPH